MRVILGGNGHAGLEERPCLGKGEMAETNAMRISRIGRIRSELSLDVATLQNARQI
jgi:uncharacterized protein (DUF849 family)